MRSPRPAEAGRLRTYAPTAALAVAAAGLAAAFLVLAGEVSGNPNLAALDQQITDAVVARRTPGLDLLFWAITLLGNALFLSVLTSAVVIVLVAWGLKDRAILVAGGIVVAQVISSLVKYAYQRPRPPEDLVLIEAPASHSFPSGHAFLTLVFSALLVFLLFRYLSRPGRPGGDRNWVYIAVKTATIATALAVVLAIGFSRVYLGVHWASDVLAGWFLGGAWCAAALAVFRSWERSRRARPDALPWGSGRARIVMVILLAVLVIAAYVVSGLADPLLV